MELFADPITVNCRKVVAGLKLLGSDYTLTKVDYFKGEQKSDAFKAINLTHADFKDKRFTRLMWLRYLLDGGLLDDSLRLTRRAAA